VAQRVGVVLAGDDRDPEGGSIGGRLHGPSTLAERAAHILRPICATVVISIGPGAINPAPKYPAVEDDPPGGRGPLAGLHAAARVTGQADLVVLACVYSSMETAFLRRMIEFAAPMDEIVMPTDGRGVDHPLAALWRRSALSQAQEALDNRWRKVSSIFPDLTVRRLGSAELAEFDLDRLLARYRVP
jgi:molybdopterin-guanine dinucleotide biosynthesis protein A